MSFNDVVLSKRGPLARVWLAATLERKVTKQSFLSASIPRSVEAIVSGEVVPMALRLSGQLLLGVARMYSRKAKYLMDDATETLSKVRLAFRQGGTARNKDVDMAADQQTAQRNAITHQDVNMNEFDAIYRELAYRNWEDALEAELAAANVTTPNKNKKRTTATNAEITLPDHDLAFETGAYDFDMDFRGRGIESQQFDTGDFDLGLDLDDLDRTPGGRASSVEIGRDAPSSAARKSNRSSFPPSAMGDMDLDVLGGLGDQTADQSTFGHGNFEFEAGADFDLGADESGHLTPRAQSPTAALDTEQQEQDPEEQAREATPQADMSKKRKGKAQQKQIVDEVTELASPSKRSTRPSSQSDENAGTKGLSPSDFLPRDPNRLRLMQLDINAYLPQLDASKDTISLPLAHCVAPELQDLFRFDSGFHKRKATDDTSPRKKQRTREESPETGRRAEVPPSSDAGFDFEAGADGADFSMGMDAGAAAGDLSNLQEDFQFEVQDAKSQADASERARSASVFSARSTTSRRSNIFVEEDTMPRGDANSLLAPFDDLRLGSAAPSTRDPTRSPAKSQAADDDTVLQGKWSKSSRVAIQILNQQLGPEHGASSQAVEQKVLNFDKAADKSSRRAAASFFFELLVLSSRDCVSVEQKRPYGDMSITAKSGLFEAAASLPSAPPSRAPSRAPSLAPSESAPLTPLST